MPQAIRAPPAKLKKWPFASRVAPKRPLKIEESGGGVRFRRRRLSSHSALDGLRVVRRDARVGIDAGTVVLVVTHFSTFSARLEAKVDLFALITFQASSLVEANLRPTRTTTRHSLVTLLPPQTRSLQKQGRSPPVNPLNVPLLPPSKSTMPGGSHKVFGQSMGKGGAGGRGRQSNYQRQMGASRGAKVSMTTAEAHLFLPCPSSLPPSHPLSSHTAATPSAPSPAPCSLL